jgi:hypothetical protein
LRTYINKFQMLWPIGLSLALSALSVQDYTCVGSQNLFYDWHEKDKNRPSCKLYQCTYHERLLWTLFSVSLISDEHFNQGCTSSGQYFARVNKFCTVSPNICGSSICNLLRGTHKAPRRLRWLLEFCKTFVSLIFVTTEI